MKVFSDFQRLGRERHPIALAAGFFDGVHRGHVAVIRCTQRQALAIQGLAWVLTFDTHPLKILHPDSAPALLTSTVHRISILKRLGLDGCLVLPFTQELARLEPAQFVRQLLECIPALRTIVVGHNWRFGHQGRGTPGLLQRLGRAAGLTVVIVPPVRRRSRPISSTRIRNEIARGHLYEAAAMLGRPFGVLGRVVRGRTQGRKLGFPTANLALQNEVLPPLGVYAVYADLGGRTMPGVLNLGVRPTFADSPCEQPTVELHLLDFEGDIYGKEIEVFFVRRLRNEKRFATLRELQQQIAADVACARRVLALWMKKKNRFTSPSFG